MNRWQRMMEVRGERNKSNSHSLHKHQINMSPPTSASYTINWCKSYKAPCADVCDTDLWHTTICDTEWVYPLSASVTDPPVTQQQALCPRRSYGQLEGCVEVVLLLVWPMDHLSTPNHQEAGVSQITSVYPVTPTIQNDYTSCATP